MNRFLPALVFSILFIWISSAQEIEPKQTAKDSLKTDLEREGIVIQDSIFEKRKKINPLAPSKAAFYSAVLPGLGQIYNKRYCKWFSLLPQIQ